MFNPKAWYLVVKIFGIVYTTFGPYQSKDECIKDMISKGDMARAAYSNGQTLRVMGVDVKPQNVKAQCQLK